MLFDFYIKLAAKELAFKSKQNDYYYQDKKFVKKNYCHFGFTNNSSPAQEIEWIELNLLQGQGISDYRQTAIDFVLAPYIVNMKKYDYRTAYNTMTQWLDKCGKKRPSTFNVRYKAKYALNRSVKE